MKNCLLALVLLSLAWEAGCAKGGNGEGSGIVVTAMAPNNISALYTNQSVTFTATVTGTTNTAVTWSLSGSACSGSGNPCGTIDSTTGAYQAPATPPSPATVLITATSQADSTRSDSLQETITLVSVVVTPLTVNVGESLVQQFTAVAVPDDAPQTFTWSCTPTGSCGSVVQDPKTSGLAVYTAPASTGTVTVAATSTIPQSTAAVGQSKVSVVTSLLPPAAYAFRFSGYDPNNSAIAAAGTITVGKTGTIAGIEDVLTASGPEQYTITSGSYTPSPNNGSNISNDLGTLTLNLTHGATNVTNKYTAVVTSSGIMRMIEADSAGTGSGVLEKSAMGFNSGGQNFVFGFTGVDSSGKRVGYVGLLPLDGSGNIGNLTSALVDGNDNGTASSYSNVTGTYALKGNGVWQMTLSLGTTTLDFDFYVSSGTAQTKTGPSPLTLYAISIDPVDSTHPALSGSMVYQVPMSSGYDNAAFAGTSVSNLTGISPGVANSSNVSLIVGVTDGTSGGTGGTGGFAGSFDQNNNGTILSVPPTSPFSYTYVASTSNAGRYVFQMLGNPTVTPVVQPLPFVLFGSGANRGFLLDQSSAAVMTGTMDPQPTTIKNFSYSPTELPGTYEAATISGSNSGITPVVQNLVLTSPGNGTYNVAGIQNPGAGNLIGAYTMNNNDISAGSVGGTGTITLTSPPPPSVASYVIYAIDANVVTGTSNAVITDFMMMGTTSGTASAIIFAQQ